jgi:hypothetical protein
MEFKSFRNFDTLCTKEDANWLVEDEWNTETLNLSEAINMCELVNDENLEVLGEFKDVENLENALKTFLEEKENETPKSEWQIDFKGHAIYVLWGRVPASIINVVTLDEAISTEVQGVINTQNEGETNFEIIGYEHPNWNSGMERWEWTVRNFTDEEKESLALSGYTLENADTQHDILVLLKDSASSYEKVDECYEKFCGEVENL